MNWIKDKCKQAVKAVGTACKRVAKVALTVGAIAVGGLTAFADAPTFADPSTITTTATTVFTAVATLMVGIVGFWVVLKIVRKISGK